VSSSVPQGNGRERRKWATRRALRAAALDLGLERGFADVHIAEITARAGVSERTFFNYFDTKEEAALLDVLTVRDEDLKLLTGPPAILWSQLTELFAADVERIRDDGADVPRLMDLQRRTPALESRQMAEFARSENRLAAAITELLDGDDAWLRACAMSGSCITAVRVGLQAWALDGWRDSPRPHVTAVFTLLAPAFTT